MAKKEPVQLPEGEGDKPQAEAVQADTVQADTAQTSAQPEGQAQAEQKVKPAQGDAKTVRPIVRVEHDGQVYEPGSDASFEVGGKQLQSLLDVKAVEIVKV
ncbi:MULTISPECIES: hypothetical protein [Pseudomonadota]|uniref:hypothetical protein n=1 Tax=Pseudomonadota TaxID=1224 RepID=UPI001BCFA286|nr:hypothetical protein [Citrobacter europaeus]ELQ8315431.1 hypothetical protein [Pseudomonas aeruginosa]MCU3413374.1 hypothetical protein [Enterobacter hormaechei subsp. steigerwaltii]